MVYGPENWSQAGSGAAEDYWSLARDDPKLNTGGGTDIETDVSLPAGLEGFPRRSSEIEDFYGEGEDIQFRVGSYVEENVIYAILSGAADIHSAPVLGGVLLAQQEANPEISSAVIDISDLTFMDSMTLGVLLSAYRRLGMDTDQTQRESSFVVRVEDQHVARIFELTLLDRIFKVERVDRSE